MSSSSRALAALRRELEEKERLLLQQQARLREELGEKNIPPPLEPLPSLPIWKSEAGEAFPRSHLGPTPARKRALARERQRERALFFICAAALVLVVVLVLWLSHTLRGG